MAKPPPSGPHSDIDGVNRDARIGVPNRDPAKGTAKEVDEADTQSVGRPDEGEVLPAPKDSSGE
jgi:hypothetical protein